MLIDTTLPGRRSHPIREHVRLKGSRNALRAKVRKSDDESDWKLFMLSFVAFFICFYTFLL